MCPGRHFASTEILAFASLILLRFDVKPVNGFWHNATFREENPGFRLPNHNTSVLLTPLDDKKWHIFFSDHGKPMDISGENGNTETGEIQQEA